MSALPKHREKIIRAAAKLFRQSGYAATGINEIAALSKAPKGSLYHYFPAGKEEIAEAALRYAGALVRDTLADLAAKHERPEAMLRAYAKLLAGWMRASDFADGCPVATTLLELAPASADIAAAGAQILGEWAGVFAAALVRAGASPERAARLGSLAIAALEGALIVARVERSERAILGAAEEVAGLFESATGR
jgi:TetR/AcrR family transcriptional regulator, lmrAB and yxaGH operons repressor